MIPFVSNVCALFLPPCFAFLAANLGAVTRTHQYLPETRVFKIGRKFVRMNYVLDQSPWKQNSDCRLMPCSVSSLWPFNPLCVLDMRVHKVHTQSRIAGKRNEMQKKREKLHIRVEHIKENHSSFRKLFLAHEFSVFFNNKILLRYCIFRPYIRICVCIPEL